MKSVQITRGMTATVDDEDYAMVSGIKWRSKPTSATTYAISRHGSMHRILMNPPTGMVVDHIDGNGLNNCKSNLRICAQGQNVCNKRNTDRPQMSSQYKGVYLDRCLWRAEIQKDGKRRRLGRFKSESDAALAYNTAAEELHGEFARLNIITS